MVPGEVHLLLSDFYNWYAHLLLFYRLLLFSKLQRAWNCCMWALCNFWFWFPPVVVVVVVWCCLLVGSCRRCCPLLYAVYYMWLWVLTSLCLYSCVFCWFVGAWNASFSPNLHCFRPVIIWWSMDQDVLLLVAYNLLSLCHGYAGVHEEEFISELYELSVALPRLYLRFISEKINWIRYYKSLLREAYQESDSFSP